MNKYYNKKTAPQNTLRGGPDFPPSSRLRTKKGISKISLLFHKH